MEQSACHLPKPASLPELSKSSVPSGPTCPQPVTQPDLSKLSPVHPAFLNPIKGASKKCHCKRSKCLKMYCECFSARVLCSGCKCANCENTEVHLEERSKAVKHKLLQNKTAFHAKFKAVPQAGSHGTLGVGDAQSQFLHAKGCHCKRSNCCKQYCECFQAGVICSEWCKCVQCVNDGSLAHLRNYGVHDWMLPACHEATGSVIGVESVMMILPVPVKPLPVKLLPVKQATVYHGAVVYSACPTKRKCGAPINAPSIKKPQHNMIETNSHSLPVLSSSCDHRSVQLSKPI